MHTVTKRYRDLPAAHRQPNHDGHCRWVHGHNWGFDVTFACDQLDENGFVVDVGKLDWLKAFLVETFDHTLLLNTDDHLLSWFRKTMGDYSRAPHPTDGLAKIVVVPNCGMEGLARFVYDYVDQYLEQHPPGKGLRVFKVVCWEDSKNSATFQR